MELIKIGIINNGTETVNNNNIDMKNWKVRLERHEKGGAYIIIENTTNIGFDSEYNYWVDDEDDIPKFFSETDWEIEWQK